MIQKKICMLGSFAVGKTSLVQRFVKSIFSEKYLTTVGVKIDKKVLSVDGTDVTMMLWDMEGEDEFQKLRISYLRGASGYLLVADGTRRETIEAALALYERVTAELGQLPFLLLVNKNDRQDIWEAPQETLDSLAASGVSVLRTSAKTGENVEEAFERLARAMLQG